ncbi:MAG: SpoIIE family protein phosphatase [Planctomycetaceae bacterium]
MARLVLLQDGEAKPFDLIEDETVLGRHPDCQVQLSSNMVSRHHARILREGTDYFLEDLGSGNGTLLNGQPVSSPLRLSHRDRIKLGPILLRYEADDPSAKPDFGQETVGAFHLDLMHGERDDSTIMGSVDSSSGYGMLDVQPESKLRGVLEITRSLAGSLDLESILPKILDTLFNIFPKADRGCILLKDISTGKMTAAAQKHRREHEDETVRLSSTILAKVLKEKTAVLSADASSDDRFNASESISSLTIRSMMCAPMIGLDGEPMGVINLDTQNPLNRFQKEDLDLLVAVANQAALSCESARLLDSHLQKEKQDNELKIARNVQHALLPSDFPNVEGYEFFASYDSAQAVGGDYYDFGMLEDRKIYLSFGDVAGKGVPGALIMSRLSSVVQTTMAFTDDLNEAIRKINNHMCANAVEGRFVTFILVVIDLNTHEMSLVNAGHMAPLIRLPDKTVEEFQGEKIGIPIGIMEDYSYEIAQRTLKPGEMVVIITDGVDEAMNEHSELYSKERVVEFVKNGPAKAEDLGRALLADVRQHANGRPQNDDITIMTFGRNPVSSAVAREYQTQ